MQTPGCRCTASAAKRTRDVLPAHARQPTTGDTGSAPRTRPANQNRTTILELHLWAILQARVVSIGDRFRTGQGAVWLAASAVDKTFTNQKPTHLKPVWPRERSRSGLGWARRWSGPQQYRLRFKVGQASSKVGVVNAKEVACAVTGAATFATSITTALGSRKYCKAGTAADISFKRRR